MTPYSLNLWNEIDDQDEYSVEIECTPGRVLQFHGVALRGPGFDIPEEQYEFGLRQICHLLVEQIGNRGLEEVCLSLAEFYDYYQPVDAESHLLPETPTRDATIAARTVRPAFAIEEE